jgi:hypothetical protein
MPMQKFLILFRKAFLPMVFLLSPNILPNVLNHRFTHREGDVFILPLEFCSSEGILIDPMGRLAFQKLGNL